MNGGARTMTQDPPQSHLLLRGELIVWHLPGAQLVINICVQLQFALLDQPQSSQCGDGLTNRACLEQRFRRYRPPSLYVCNAVASRPNDFALIEESNADTGYVVVTHSVLELHPSEGLPLDRHRRQKTILDVVDVWSVGVIGEGPLSIYEWCHYSD